MQKAITYVWVVSLVSLAGNYFIHLSFIFFSLLSGRKYFCILIEISIFVWEKLLDISKSIAEEDLIKFSVKEISRSLSLSLHKSLWNMRIHFKTQINISSHSHCPWCPKFLIFYFLFSLSYLIVGTYLDIL